MKRTVLAIAMLIQALVAFSQTPDDKGHVLVNLWKSYYKAVDADLPQDQAKTLETIKKEAQAKHLAWDWYDAASQYVKVRSSINWKDRDELRKALNHDVDSFGEPIVVFYHYSDIWNNDRRLKYVQEHKAELQKSSNLQFYAQDSRLRYLTYGSALLRCLNNDYEYALWSASLKYSNRALADYYNGRYPEAAFVEYSQISSRITEETTKILKDYATKYKGKAVSLLARQQVLNYEFASLGSGKKSTSAQAKKLRDDCSQFEADRRKFSGDEKLIADCCTKVKGLIKSLDSKEISLDVTDGELSVRLRNLPSAELHILSGLELLHKAALNNKARSYYLPDTLKYRLPDLDDGDYELVCMNGETKQHTTWYKHSLSIALRPDSDGDRVFVADFNSGKPVKQCDLQLFNAEGNSVVFAPGIAINGFTLLPKIIQKYLDDSSFRGELRASYQDSKGKLYSSGKIKTFSSSGTRTHSTVNPKLKHALVLTDRSAFNPGETVHVKGICYVGMYEYETSPADVPVQLCLYDPEDKLLASKELSTNEFGSVQADFVLPHSKGGSFKGGMYSIKLRSSVSTWGSKDIRVDEFVLPTFAVSWDVDNNMYLQGDEITVKGKLKAYSGHNLASAQARIEVSRYRTIILKDDLTLAPDGSFSFSFPSDAKEQGFQQYQIRVIVTDATGETLEFTTHREVRSTPQLNVRLLNEVGGSYTMVGSRRVVPYNKRAVWGSAWIVRDDEAQLFFNTGDKQREGLTINYILRHSESGKQVRKGSAAAGETLNVDVKGLASALYTLEVTASAKLASGKTAETKQSYTLLKASDSDTALDMKVSSFFKELGDNEIALQIGSTDGPVWAVVELFGDGNKLLDQQIVTLDGVRGRKGSLKTIRYDRRAEWPESLCLKVFWFHKGESYTYSRSIELPRESEALPLSFTRFTEKARPGEQFSLLVKTLPGVECAAAVFDKATETIAPNEWFRITPERRYRPEIYYQALCGRNNSYENVFYKLDEAIPMQLRSKGIESEMAVNDAAAAGTSAEAPAVRENFCATMAWEPLLRSDDEGNIEIKLKGADRLSTYCVQLFAHAAGMRSEVLRRELQITVPVKLSLVEPQFLYQGDLYVARVSLASNLQTAVRGRLAIRFYEGSDWRGGKVLGTKMESIELAPGGTASFQAPFAVPEGLSELGVLLNFVPDDGSEASDALFVTIPVKHPVQTLTEAHSALLRNTAGRENLIAELRSQFVNLDASALEPQEISILQMLQEAIPDKITPSGKDVLSLTEAWYANILARRLGAPGLDDEALQELGEKIAACQSSGGGIAWFEGMKPSPVITAAVLQRVAAMPEVDCSVNIAAAVKYLDYSYFENAERPWWWGGLSLEKYLQTRALYAYVPFSEPDAKTLKQFKHKASEYLAPKNKRGLNSQILAKARRLSTLQALSQSPEGLQLAKAWGVSFKQSLKKSVEADIKSLKQYAVEHKSGGWYYPNAVMPWRGLLESELYAHTLLCSLLDKDASTKHIAEGIRLWMMVQKETQQWGRDAAYIEAIAQVLNGSPETLQTSVILLSGSYTKPFEEVKAAGNAMSIERKWYRNGSQLQDGDSLHVGDKVVAQYSIWSEENRSFVRLTAPRPASFRPIDQLSGFYGWWLAPLSYGVWSYAPQGYRNVLSDKTEYWFDSYPEEKTSVSEEFFVTQEGRFQTPVVEIESLYAPHYRANGAGCPAIESK